jgi:hypothetical protein
MTRNTQVEQIASAVHSEAGHSILAYFPRALSRLRRFGEFFEVFRRLFVVICVPSPWSYVPERNPARECRIFGAPQSRKRLVLIASRLGVPQLPEPSHPKPEDWITVRATISNLPAIKAGATHTTDPVHTSSRLTPINLKRIRASIPGGTWRDWPTQLIAKCHTRESGLIQQYTVAWCGTLPVQRLLGSALASAMVGSDTRNRTGPSCSEKQPCFRRFHPRILSSRMELASK